MKQIVQRIVLKNQKEAAMSSKNVLWLGSLLFLLLVTSCIAFFIDRFNPQITAVSYSSAPSAHQPRDKTAEDRFTEHVTIATMPEAEESNRTTLLSPQVPDTETKSKPLTVPAKAASSATAPRPVAPASQGKPPVQQHLKVPGTKPRKQHKKTPPAAVDLKIKTTPALIVEPVLQSEMLTPSRSGKLYRRDRLKLSKIATRTLRNRELAIVLRSDRPPTPQMKRYLTNIVHYLRRYGLSEKRIRIEATSHATESGAVRFDKKNGKIELLLIERI